MSKEYFDHHGHADHYPNFDVNKQYPEGERSMEDEYRHSHFQFSHNRRQTCFVGDDAGRLLALQQEKRKTPVDISF